MGKNLNSRNLLQLLCVIAGISIVHSELERNIPVITPIHKTVSLLKYDHSPSTPDADTPSIYVSDGKYLVFGTAKNAGLGVWDGKGILKQWIAPTHREETNDNNPPTPAGLHDVTLECDGSIENDLFGRYNGVTYLKNVEVQGVKTDLAIVTDRGCDQLRVFSIDSEKDQVLTEITHESAPRVFPMRINQASPFQNAAEHAISSNPLIDQNTAYGITSFTDSKVRNFVFVSQLFRSVVVQVEIFDMNGKITYKVVRHFVFDMVHTLETESGAELQWTPCREDPAEEEPMAEGMAVHSSGVLYVGFEDVGLFKIQLNILNEEDSVVHIDQEYLVSPVKDYGKSYAAMDDGWEIKCKYDAKEDVMDDKNFSTVYVKGSSEHNGKYIESDLEGVAIAEEKYVVVSSQGDSTFHIFAHSEENEHLGSFQVEGVRRTDGIAIYTGRDSGNWSGGLVVVHNGKAEKTGKYYSSDYADEISGATGYVYLKWKDVKEALNIE